MQGEELKQIRKNLNLTQKELALWIRVSVRTLSRWECGDSSIPDPVIKLLLTLPQKDIDN